MFSFWTAVVSYPLSKWVLIHLFILLIKSTHCASFSGVYFFSSALFVCPRDRIWYKAVSDEMKLYVSVLLQLHKERCVHVDNIQMPQNNNPILVSSVPFSSLVSCL